MQRSDSESPGWRHRPLLRKEFDKLVLTGVFGDQRIQLLEGELVEMSPQGTQHATTIRHLNRIFARALSDRYELGVQTPMAASDISEPEPDLAVHRRGDYRKDHPQAALLVIEVAWRTLGIDLGRKVRIYAQNGVPDYWVVDTKNWEIVVHRKPDPARGTYANVRRYKGSEVLAPLKLPQLELRVSAWLPRH
jgi:Uma2 family endonuclease